MIDSMQITVSSMISRLRVGEVLLAPLVIKSCVVPAGTRDEGLDARLEVGMPGRPEGFRFVVQTKTRGTPQNIQLAMLQARAATRAGEWPMIQVPYLSPEKIGELEKAGVSGVDLCGNGVVVVPGQLWVVRVGAENRFRDSRPLSNPYRGRSALVARMLLRMPRWQTLSELAAEITSAGGELSLPQVSKAVQAMAEDLIVSKESGVIRLRDPLRLLDNLGAEWKKPRQFWSPAGSAGRTASRYSSRQPLRLPKGTDWAQALSSASGLRWGVSGESSVGHYAIFAQGGPRRIVVSDMGLALARLGGTPEPVPSFADIELLESEDQEAFFDLEVDENGVRWAGKLQTWLELQAGDARQQEAAKDIREQILKEAGR